MATHQAVLIPGDGIGPEVTVAVRRILDAAGAPIEWVECRAGLAALERGQDVLPRETLDAITRLQVALKGPCTTPIGEGFVSINVRLRKELDLYAAVKRAARKLLAENHPDRNPGNQAAEDRYKAVSEARSADRSGKAQGIRRDPSAVRQRWRLRRGRFSDGGGGNFGGFGGDGAEFNLERPVRRRRPDRRRQHRRPVRRAVRTWGAAAAAQQAAARQRPGDRDRAVLPRGHQGRGDAVAADQPGAVHQLPRQRRASGHQPEGVPELQRRGRHQPQPGRVRLLRTVHRMPGQRLDHRAPVRRVQRHRRHHPHPHHQRADPAWRRGRSADPAGRPGRGRSARRAVGRPVRDRAREGGQGVSAATATTSRSRFR